MRYLFSIYALGAVMMLIGNAPAGAQGTAITYQGRLTDNGVPATGLYDLQFLLFDALAVGNQQGVTLQRSGVGVTNGLFTVTLDFGQGIFDGSALWLEIRASPPNVGNYTTLAPRQPVTPAPYAIWAANAGSAASASSVAWNSITGIPGGLADGVDNDTLYSAGAGLALVGNVFSLNSAFTDARYWKLTGNGGTTPGVNFLGTTDHQALELRVNNARAFRLEPTAGSPNLIGGSGLNEAASGVLGATIAGGGSAGLFGVTFPNRVTDNFGAVGGGILNLAGNDAGGAADAAYSTVGGGVWNGARGLCSTVAGGSNNVANGNASAIGGGWLNSVLTNAGYASIGGGRANTVGTNADYSVIAGGYSHTIEVGAQHASIGGGNSHQIGASASSSTIAGGSSHEIRSGASYASIGGGTGHTIDANSDYSTISGGYVNTIKSNSWHVTISGGASQVVEVDADYGTIGGGRDNTISANAVSVVIAGGDGNTVRSFSELATIGGGGSNVIESNSFESVIAGGYDNRISTNSAISVIGGGDLNTIDANASHNTIAGGGSNSIEYDADYVAVGGGRSNSVNTNADYATIPGGRYARARNFGQFAYATSRFAETGDAQTSMYVLRGTTSGAVTGELFLDGADARMIVPPAATWAYEALVVGRSTSGNSAAFRLTGYVKRTDADFTGQGSTTSFGRDIVSWNAEARVEATRKALVITTTGSANQTIRWVASVRTVEVIN